MRTLGNILWHIPFLGFLNATMVYLFGILLTITVIAAPLGMGLMEYGKFLFVPFGRAMVSKSTLDIKQNKYWKAYSTIIMIIWIPFGLLLSIIALFQIAGLFITIIGIPMALVVAKSIGTYFNPVNKKCVHQAVYEEIEKKKAQKEIEKHLGE